MLQYLVTVSKGPAQRFEVLGQMVSSLFDSNPSLNSHLKTSVWKKCVINLLEMMKILQENPHIKVCEQKGAWGHGTRVDCQHGRHAGQQRVLEGRHEMRR